jgi:hypothetical protein
VSGANNLGSPTKPIGAAPRLPGTATAEVENLLPEKKLPPSPADVRRYFEQRRHSITGFSPEDVVENERLWLAVCEGRRAPVRNLDGGGGLITHGNVRTAPRGLPTRPAGALERRRAALSPPAVCRTCGVAFTQPRGPSSRDCSGCRKGLRQEAARDRMRQLRAERVLQFENVSISGFCETSRGAGAMIAKSESLVSSCQTRAPRN